MTGANEIGEDMGTSPVSQRECDVRFEVVKEIREDVRNLSDSIRGDVSDIKVDLSGLRADMSSIRTGQTGHIKNHEKTGRSLSTWVAIVIAFLMGVSALVFGVLNHK